MLVWAMVFKNGLSARAQYRFYPISCQRGAWLYWCILILALLAVIICQIIRIGVRSDNMYEGLLCYGVGTFIAVEAAINVGGVTGLLPITGVTFPFISYGGSSMLALSIALGLAMNVSIRQKLRRKNQRRLQAIRQRRIG